MLRIKDLKASIEGNKILKGLDLEIKPGEVHAIMGPNGAGKSTLSQVLAGRDGYVTSGVVEFDGADLLEMAPEERAAKGLFLAFQYPVEIPGVGNMYFLRTAVNAVRRERGEAEVDAVSFLKDVKLHMAELDMDPSMLSRSVNAGFSGGEKKRNEVLQMAMLQPRLAILDETDSGLDIDALRLVAGGVQRLRSPERSMLIITHYPRLLEYVVPDFVHVLSEGRIVRTGDASLANELEDQGYGPTELATGAAPAGSLA
ncbi:MAG: Fe-S cluster assembly ATPase SufC [Microthrixaceae bacterium]